MHSIPQDQALANGWKATRRTILSVLAVLPLAAHVPVGVAAADVMAVIRASGTTFVPGQLVDESKKLVLPRGARITLIRRDGVSITLVGPYAGLPPTRPVARGEAWRVRELADAISNGSRTVQVPLATRGPVRPGGDTAGRVGIPRDAWSIPSGVSGTYCLRDDGPNFLWRASSHRAPVVSLAPRDGGWSARQVWAKGRDRLVLPRIPRHGAGAVLLATVGDHAFTMNLLVVPSSLDTVADRIIWMTRAGCGQQARALIESLG